MVPPLCRDALEALWLRACALDDQGKPRVAFRLLRRAAEAGHHGSQLHLGVLYDTGRGVRRSRERALHWYRKGARRREAAAASNIGTLYRDEGRMGLAVRWFERAVEWGDADALLELAKLYLGPLQDRPRARRLLARLRRNKGSTTPLTQEEATLLLAGLEASTRT